VIAHINEGEITELWVNPNGWRAGGCEAIFLDENAEGLIRFLMAGFWAQHHIADEHYPWESSRFDAENWKRFIRQHELTDEDEDRLWAETEAQVLQHRRLILHTAKRLRKGRSMEKIVHFLQTRPYLETAR